MKDQYPESDMDSQRPAVRHTLVQRSETDGYEDLLTPVSDSQRDRTSSFFRYGMDIQP